jgi:hypothetical protein
VGALSEGRTSLSFVYAAGPCQSSLSRVRIHSYSRPYITVSDLRLSLSCPPTTRRVTVEVFERASTRVILALLIDFSVRFYLPLSDCPEDTFSKVSASRFRCIGIQSTGYVRVVSGTCFHSQAALRFLL